MAGATFYDMQPLCYIDDTDFTDYQGIGSDPMYRRYDSIYSIIKKHIEPQYRGLLARPHYEDGCIHWYVERWNEPPIPLNRLSGEERDRYEKIKDETLSHYRRRMEAMNIEERTILTGALRFVSDEFVYCYDGRVTLVAWGMRPDPYRHPVDGSWVKGLKFVEAYSLTFDPGTMGTLRQSTSRVVRRQRGHRIEAADLPEVVAFAGCRFRGWDPSPTGMEVTADTVFTAQYDGAPDVIANRLNVYFEDENADLNRWAHDFKRAYPSDDYRIIGADPNVRMIQIQIPEDRRDRVREELNAKIPGQDFFVVDESIITLRTGQNGTAGTQGTSGTANAGWHLRATHLQEAWSVSRGTNDVVVAIVDDGIDVAHPVFKGRFFKAYNVFTQNRRLSAGSGHGTHVAALAAGSDQYIAKGVAGVAPQCRIMPIQVFDNGICTFSSIASGIMYAIHNGADVVNVSIGPSFPGIDNLPLEEQRKIARTYFKNEERVYRHIIKTANEKNVILVFAAGNDNIMTAILPECRYAGNTVNVAAVGPDFKAARFSNYAEGTNLSAPGVDINSAYPHSTFKMLEGTSMAAPIVAGTIALMRSLKRDVTVSQAVDVIRRTGQDVGNDIPVMVRPDRALAALKSGSIATQPADSTATPDPDPDNIPPVQGDAGTIDEYAAYRKRLEELRRQRENIDRQISDIEKQINNNK